MKKLSIAILVLSFMFCAVAAFALTESNKEELMKQLKELRTKKAGITTEYDDNMRKAEKAANDRMAALKKEYRESHNACLAEKRDKCKELRKDYEAKLRPMLHEEERLVQSIGRDAMEDFAKGKADKKRK